MTILRMLVVASAVLAMFGSALAAGKPGSVGTGTGTATAAGAQLPTTGQPATTTVSSQQGTGTAQTTPAAGTPAQPKIGQGTTK
jgi:hypothetical protein